MSTQSKNYFHALLLFQEAFNTFVVFPNMDMAYIGFDMRDGLMFEGLSEYTFPIPEMYNKEFPTFILSCRAYADNWCIRNGVAPMTLDFDGTQVSIKKTVDVNNKRRFKDRRHPITVMIHSLAAQGFYGNTHENIHVIKSGDTVTLRLNRGEEYESTLDLFRSDVKAMLDNMVLVLEQGSEFYRIIEQSDSHTIKVCIDVSKLEVAE